MKGPSVAQFRLFAVAGAILLALVAARRAAAQTPMPEFEACVNIDTYSGAGTAEEYLCMTEPGTLTNTVAFDAGNSNGDRDASTSYVLTVTVEAGVLTAAMSAVYVGHIGGSATGSFDANVGFILDFTDPGTASNDPEDRDWRADATTTVEVTGADLQRNDLHSEVVEFWFNDDAGDIVSECPVDQISNPPPPCLGAAYTHQSTASRDVGAEIEYRLDLYRESNDPAFVKNATVLLETTVHYYPLDMTQSLDDAAVVGSDPHLPGDNLQVTWSSSNLNEVRLLFTEHERGAQTVWQDLGLRDAGFGITEWMIPDSTLCYRCRIVVQSPDGSLSDTTDAFTIKGYELTRIVDGERYERFSLPFDAWAFANVGADMWPMAWYQQFDYATAMDPVLNRPYPATWLQAPINARPTDFPDWPLWVETFGVDQSYVLDSLGAPVNYRQEAVNEWVAWKGMWGGSCLGFSIAALLAFDNDSTAAARYPDLGPFGIIGNHPVNDGRRRAINSIWLAQNDDRFVASDDALFDIGGSGFLTQVQQMLLNDDAPLQDVTIYNVDSTGATHGGHSIVTRGIVRDDGFDPPRYRVYVYDSNDPRNENTYIEIDVNNASTNWSFASLSWSGNRGIYLSSKTAPDYVTSLPQFSKRGQAYRRWAHSEEATFVYMPAGTAVTATATDGSGGQLSTDGVVARGSLEGGRPIIPITGSAHPPIGFRLPTGAYDLEVTQFAADNRRLTVRDSASTYTVHGNPADGMRFGIRGGGFVVHNPATSATPAFGIQTNRPMRANDSAAGASHVVDVTELTLAATDSVLVKTAPGGGLELGGAAQPTSYRLAATSVADTGEVVLRVFDPISLDGGALHDVTPDWSPTNAGFSIGIDDDGDGQTDRTIFASADRTSTAVESSDGGPEPLLVRIETPYPNPVTGVATVRFVIPSGVDLTAGSGAGAGAPGPNGIARIAVFDVLGRLVHVAHEGPAGAGEKAATFDTSGWASGVYFVRLTVGASSATARFVKID